MKHRPRHRDTFRWLASTIALWLLATALSGCGPSQREISRAEQAAVEALRGLLAQMPRGGQIAGEAFVLLARTKRPDITPGLIEALGGFEEPFLFQPIRALGEMGDGSAAAPLRGLFESSHNTLIKIEAALAIARLGPDDKTDWLIHTLADDEVSINRACAASALGQLGDPAASVTHDRYRKTRIRSCRLPQARPSLHWETGPTSTRSGGRSSERTGCR